MQSAVKLRTAGLVSSLVLASMAFGCGPRVFSDGDALAILGTGPAEPEQVEAPPEPTPEKRVEMRDNKIVINEKVQFEVNSAKIKHESHSLLDEVAKVIKENPQIKGLEVGGHASSEGAENKNQQLSARRAKSVKKYLSHTGGVDKAILTSKGYGEGTPIASNDTEDGRVQNRRVEFLITEQDVTQTKVEVDDEGNEKVIEEKKVKG